MKMTEKRKEALIHVVSLPMVVFLLSFCITLFVGQGLVDLAMANTVNNNNFLQKIVEKLGESPSPTISKALHSVNRQYCLMTAQSQGRMQHRLAILGIKTPVRTGIYWPLVMYYHRVCAPTKADLRIYEQAHVPIVQAVRRHFYVPVWNIHQAYQFCTKREGVKAVSPAMQWQMEQVFNGCLAPKK